MCGACNVDVFTTPRPIARFFNFSGVHKFLVSIASAHGSFFLVPPTFLSLFLFIIRSLSRRCCGRWCVRHHLMLIIISLLCESRMCPTNRRLADVENYPKHAAMAQAKQCQQFPWPHGGRVHIAKWNGKHMDNYEHVELFDCCCVMNGTY